MGTNRRRRGRALLIALALLASCSQSRVDVVGPADTISDTSTATTTVVIPPSTVTSTTAAPSTTPVPSPPSSPTTATPSTTQEDAKLWRPLARRAQVVPAFVAFVDESGRAVGIKPTLGTAPATVVHRVRDGSTIDGLSVTADGTAVLVGERFGCAALVRRIDVSSGATATFLEGESTPQLSPDGRWLATVVHEERAGSCRARLRVRDLVAATSYEIDGTTDRPPNSFVWSPDSTRLAYVTCEERCVLFAETVAARVTTRFGSDAYITGPERSGPYRVEPSVSWSPLGYLTASGTCACEPHVASLSASVDEWNNPWLRAYPREADADILQWDRGENELVLGAMENGAAPVYRRHGRGPLVPLGIRSNGFVAWPSAREWDGPLPSKGSRGQPMRILANVQGSLAVVESDTGATVRILAANNTDGFALDRTRNEVIVGQRLDKCGMRLVAIPLDGGPPRELGRGVEPALSPDGKKLAYAASLWERAGVLPPTPGGIGCALSAVVVRDLATDDEQVIFPPRFDPRRPETGGWESHAQSLGWSPDQRRLVISYVYEGGSTFVYDFASGETTPVAPASHLQAVLKQHAELTSPLWRPDGSLDLVASCYACQIQPILVRADDGYTITGTLGGLEFRLDVRDQHVLARDYGTGITVSIAPNTARTPLRDLFDAIWLD